MKLLGAILITEGTLARAKQVREHAQTYRFTLADIVRISGAGIGGWTRRSSRPASCYSSAIAAPISTSASP